MRNLSSVLVHRAVPFGPLVLMYHSVRQCRGVPAWTWAVSLERFERQLDVLADAGWGTTTVRELVSDPSRWNKPSVVVTLDDGYADNLVACDALARRGMRATLFVVSGSVAQLPAWAASGPRPRQRLLNATELRDLSAAGFEIGSHSMTHMRLPDADDSGLRAELAESKRQLEEMLGCEVSSFAYPFGDWDARCAEMAKQTGYRAACTTSSGWALRDLDPFRMRRLSILNTDSTLSFSLKLLLATNDVSWRALARYALRRAYT